MGVFADEDAIRALKPDMAALVRDIGKAVLVTAPGRDCDFVSRYFAPHGGIPRGSGDRLGALRADPLLGEAAGQAAGCSRASFRRAAASSPARTAVHASASAAAPPSTWKARSMFEGED